MLSFFTRYRDLWLQANAKVEAELRSQLRARDEQIKTLADENAQLKGKLERLELYFIPALNPARPRLVHPTTGAQTQAPPESSWQTYLKTEIAKMEEEDRLEAANKKAAPQEKN